MSDFANAFRAGQDAATKARTARETIRALINQVSDDLSKATAGELVVELRDFNDAIASTANAIAAVFSMPQYEKRRYLSAANPKRNATQFVRLAKWTQGEEGFPCTLEYGKHEMTSYDIQSLEAAFTELLANVTIGEKLAALLAPEKT